MLSRILVLVFLVSCFAGASCVHPCLALAEEMCECEATESEVETCKRQARTIFDQAPSEDLSESRSLCSELLDVCTCEYLATEEGKRECGLAREQ